MDRMEVDSKKLIDQKIGFLEQNDIKMQKEFAEIFDSIRELRTKVGILN